MDTQNYALILAKLDHCVDTLRINKVQDPFRDPYYLGALEMGNCIVSNNYHLDRQIIFSTERGKHVIIAA